MPESYKSDLFCNLNPTMNFPESNPDYQILLSKIREFSQENSFILEKLGLEIIVKSNLSKPDQIYQIFSSNFEVPVEITVNILSYLSVTHLYKELDCDFHQLQLALEKTGFDNFVEELREAMGFYVFISNLE